MKKNDVDAVELAENLGMSPQEEGGLVKENHYAFAGPGRASSGQAYYFFKPNVSTLFHRLDCDEYWCYVAGDALESWTISPEGKLELRTLGASKGCEPCLFFKKGDTFAAKHTDPNAVGTMIIAITVPRYNNDALELFDREQVIKMCPAAKAFFEKG